MNVFLVDFEMKDVGDLEIGTVVEHKIAANDHVHEIRRWRRKHYFQLMRARLHPAAQAGRQGSVHNQLPLQSWRKTVALGESGRETVVMLVVPAADVAVVIDVVLVIPVMVFLTAAAIAVMIGVAVMPPIVV